MKKIMTGKVAALAKETKPVSKKVVIKVMVKHQKKVITNN